MNLRGEIAGVMVFAGVLAAGIFGFVQEAYAVYPSDGLLASSNLLAGQGASTISSFTANVSSLPAGTGLRVSFSRDGSKWYSSTGAALGWNTLSAGANVIDLSARGWSGNGFYYKMEFTSDGSSTPVLDDISLAFTPAPDGVYQTYSTGGTLTSTNLLTGETVSLITGFSYEASAIPAGTSLAARFSRDGVSWYSSTGATTSWNTLAAGVNNIDVSGLGWTGANFYYRIQFTSDASDTPVLDSVNVAFAGIPQVSFQSGALIVSETGGLVTLHLTLSQSPALQVSVPYTISGVSTATLGSDYGVITGSPLILAPGETSTGIILNLTDDTIGEGNETVILTLGSPTNATLGSTGTLILTITSNDTPEVSFQSGSLTLSETSGTASILLTLSGSSARDITIPFSFGGTATGTGSDYTILTPSPLTLEAGESSTGILLQFINDSSVESNKTIILTIGSPTNATLGSTGSITITLTSDDVAAAASSSSEATVGNTGGGGGGGFRGSPSQMAARIAQARTTILARFEGKRQQSQQLAAQEDQKAGEEQTAKEREDRIAKRIAEHEAVVAQSQKEQEELQKKYALHREERYAKALALQEEQLAEQQADLLVEREALQAEQDANRSRREERFKEQDRRTAQQILAEKEEETREEQAAKEREDRIAVRIAEHEADLAQSQKEQEELQKKYALHREERYARALAQEQEHALAAQTAMEEAQRAMQEEQKANAERREQRLAERESERESGESGTQVSAPARLSTSPEVIAARRGKLFALVGDVPVIFADVSLDEWYAPYVSYVIEEKIATGYADEAGKPKGEFGVEKPITYAEVLKMALQASDQVFDLRGLPPPRNLSAKGSWAAAYIAQAEVLQLSVFPPNLDVTKPATRGAVIQTLLEVLGIPTGPKAETSYSDVPASHPYARAIAMATYLELVSGDKDASGNSLNRFRPDDPINRAEVAKIIALAKEILK